jgi:hypothetical protein
MADIFGTYRLSHYSPGAGTLNFYSTGIFPQGINVYVSTAISQVRADDNAVAQNNGVAAFAFIYEWSVYGAGGQITPVTSPADPFLSAKYINNCAKITLGVLAGGGGCTSQITIFRI